MNTTSTDLAALTRESIAAFNRADWDGVCATRDPAGVYEETGTGRRIEGIDALIEALQAWRSAFPDVTGEVVRVLVEGDTSTVEVRWRGTHTGPLATAAGVLPATGAGVEIWSAMWLTWMDGRIVHERHHLDMLSMLAQIGALPAPADAR
jgi:steroid delta-isomerase-like uncharacterized protein